MAIKFSQFNERTDHTSGMYLVGYDGNQNIHITVDNLFDDFINGTENTIAMFGVGGTALADSILSQDAGATLLTVAGQLNVDAAATFDTNITVTGNSTLNGNVGLGGASTDSIIQTGTLYLNGPVKDVTDTLGAANQVLLSNASGNLAFTYLADLHVGGAEVVEVPVKNTQGSPLVKGDPVYISGSVGASGRLEVQLADASNTLKMPAVGLLKQDLANNAEGFAVVTGKLRNLITDPIDGVTPTENDVIYVKPSGTSGAALTTTKPVYGNFIQNVGKVGRVSSGNSGNFVVSSILRTNDIPNLTPGRLWIGSTGNTIESQRIFVNEATGAVGIGTASPYYTADIAGTIRSSGQASFAELGPISIAQVGGNSSTLSKIDIISTFGGSSLITATNTLTLKASSKDAIEINNTGAIQFNEYGSGAFTGTVAKNLSIDSSGNIIETNPSVDGSGTLNYVTKWTPDGNTLGNSIIFDNGTQVGVGTTSPAGSVKLHVEGALRVNDGNLNITNNFLTILYLNTSSSSTDNYALQNSGGNFQVKNNSGLGQIQFQILNSGQAKLDLYGQSTFTGTAAKNLSVTSSGAIIETPAVPANIVETVTTTDGTYINLTPNTATDGAVTITADLSATDGTSASGERYLTKTNKWATVASIPGTYTFSVTGDTGTPEAIASGATLDIAGGTNISTVVGLAADTVTVNLDDSISLPGSLTVGTTGNFTGQVTIPQVPSANTDAASKHYVDQAVTGALSYQGGYNPSTNIPDLTSSPNSILKGWTYTVTADDSFFGEQVRVGDVLIAEIDNPTNLTDWTTVQNNIDLADLNTVGIGNVAAGTNIGVSYSNGTATISNAITNNNQLTNGAGYLTSGSLPTVNNGTLTLSTSAGLDGGASFTANQSGNSTFTVSLDLSELTDMTGGVNGTNDELILLDSGAERRKRIGEISLSQFDNDLNWTSNYGDITGVTAGNALTGGGTFGTVTLNLSNEGPGAGTYGSASDSAKIDNITIDAYGRIMGITTGSTGSMTSWTIKEGNGTESTSVTNGETFTIAQGTGIQSELVATQSGGTIQITNTAPNVSTNLSTSTSTTSVTVNSSDGTNATIGEATGSAAGVMSTAHHNKLDGIAAGATNVTNNNQISNGRGYTTNTGDITGVTAGSYMTGGGTSGTVTLNANASTSATANTLAARDSSRDISVRLLRADYANQSTISGAIAFRVNNGADNYTRYCSSPSAIRTFIGALSTTGKAADSNLLDGINSSSFLRSDAADTFTGKLSVGNTNIRRAGIYGLYDSTRTGHIWSMGTAYQIPDNGANFGNLYGAAYKHTNNSTGGTMGGGHQLVWCDNGNPRGSIGYTSMWHAESMRAPIFFDTANTNYYTNPYGTSVLKNLTLRNDNAQGYYDGTIEFRSNSNSLGSQIEYTAGPGFSGYKIYISASGASTSHVQYELEDRESTFQSGTMHLKNNIADAVNHSTTGVNLLNTPALKVYQRSTNISYTYKDLVTFHASTGAAQKGSIRVNAYGTQYATSSDYRLKENEIPIADGIQRVKQLQPKRFNFIGYSEQSIDGFMAHEVQDVVHDAVSGVKDEVDEEGNPVYQSIDQSKLVPLLTAALQDAITKIENLETRIQILENQ